MSNGIKEIFTHLNDFPERPVFGKVKKECFLKGEVTIPKKPLGIR
tara:strand:+ start:807 stop:941 length:135 start_codon:yes stop_codon:yes gene_type:complete